MINKQNFRLKQNGKPCSNCYCRNPELIENYDKAISDETQTWEVHHRKEEFYSQKELKERNEYFDVPPEDLIFLTHKEHCKIDSFRKRDSESMINHKDLSKRVLCLETGEIFESTMDAQRKTGIYHGNISKVCHGKLKISGGYHWKFV